MDIPDKEAIWLKLRKKSSWQIKFIPQVDYSQKWSNVAQDGFIY